MMRLSRWIGCFALACTLPGEAEGHAAGLWHTGITGSRATGAVTLRW